jgi:hypothetical protein
VNFERSVRAVEDLYAKPHSLFERLTVFMGTQEEYSTVISPETQAFLKPLNI